MYLYTVVSLIQDGLCLGMIHGCPVIGALWQVGHVPHTMADLCFWITFEARDNPRQVARSVPIHGPWLSCVFEKNHGWPDQLYQFPLGPDQLYQFSTGPDQLYRFSLGPDQLYHFSRASDRPPPPPSPPPPGNRPGGFMNHQTKIQKPM